MSLRDAGVTAPLLLLGERQEAELPWCVKHDLTVCINDANGVRQLAARRRRPRQTCPGPCKDPDRHEPLRGALGGAPALLEMIGAQAPLLLAGAMTHFAQSDEADKGFAGLQISRFDEVMTELTRRGARVPCQHLCNSGGFWICRRRIATWCVWAS